MTDNDRDWSKASPEELKISQGKIRTITVENTRGGQPRAYADSEYEGYITFSVPEGQLWASKYPSRVEDVKPYVKLLIHNFIEDAERQWHEPWLEKLERVSENPNKWYALVKSPYLD